MVESDEEKNQLDGPQVRIHGAAQHVVVLDQE
jgi:hypothetical protein